MNLQNETRVLIVEDDFLVSEVVRREVENLGYIVLGEAQDGRRAVEMARSLQPDVILMDIEMPDMDGIEATLRIYKCCPTPVVILTAYDRPELVEQVSEAGAGAYLVKMPNSREIERAITIAMARFGDTMALRRLNAELKARNDELQTRNSQLQAALNKVKLLSGFIPICANCKKIRDDDGYWQDVAVYVRDHSEAEFSHGICPACMEELYPDFVQKTDEQNNDILDALQELGWASPKDISAQVKLPESNILARLKKMSTCGQLVKLDVEGEDYYWIA